MLNRCKVVVLIFTLISCSVVAATPSTATQPIEPSYKVGKIIVLSNPIFDESANNAIFLHHWANALHINTHEYVILDRLSFTEGDIVTRKTLDEAQRILRAEPYLRDAKITIAEPDPTANQPGTTNILVQTWDQWSLLPTVDFGRSGGKNKFAIGIKDDNILGSGVQSELEYQTDEDRSGYKLKVEAPITWVEHGNVAGAFTNNDDGTEAYLAFTKPFYTLADDYSYGFSYNRNDRINTFRQNGVDVSQYREKLNYNNIFWGVKLAEQGNTRQRLRFGITQDFHNFEIDGYLTRIPLPQDREYLYPWASWEFLQDEFIVMQNVHLINFNEDINLGWHHTGRIGIETHDNDGLGYHFWWNTDRGFSSEHQLLLLNAQAKLTQGTQQPDYLSASARAEYFYRFNPKWVAYTRLRTIFSHNRYFDLPLGLGDENGVRGYPNQFQLGDNQWILTAELRNYPNINLYQLAELGWVAFVDVGRASGGQLAKYNEVDGAIGAVGIGARIYSSRSSYGNVVHIDFSMPFSNSEHVDGWEWRFEVKRHF